MLRSGAVADFSRIRPRYAAPPIRSTVQLRVIRSNIQLRVLPIGSIAVHVSVRVGASAVEQYLQYGRQMLAVVSAFTSPD